MSRQPILKTLKRDHQILTASFVRARANHWRLIELFGLLQIGHSANRIIKAKPHSRRRGDESVPNESRKQLT
jgi:hypothetical protein